MATTQNEKGRDSGKSATPTTRAHDTALTLRRITWSHQNVITTDMLAQLYGTEPVRIRQNFASNATRFEAGKHFFKVAGDDLDSLRVAFNDSHISPKARTLILWTERGAARHAKMLETDRAWDVFEALEDSYFRAREIPLEPTDDPSTVRDRRQLYHCAVDMMVTRRISLPRAYQAMSFYAGVPSLREMTKRDVVTADSFATRYVDGTTTPQDFDRIERNRAALNGDAPQLPLLGGAA